MQGAAPWRPPLESRSAQEEVMRSTYRLFLAAILLTAAAGIVRAQDPPAPAAPDVAKPVAELPPLPAAEPVVPAVEPALTESAPAIEPASVPATVDPAPVDMKVTTTRVTRKTTRKMAEKPAVVVAEPSKPAAIAAGAATVETTGSASPPAAAASVAPAPPPARAAVTESRPEEAAPQKKISIGSWILAAVFLLAMAGIAVRFLRVGPENPAAIVEFPTIVPQLPKAVPVPRL
jgi:hypothetical protein